MMFSLLNTSGEHRKPQKRIRLERFAHDRTDHIQHLPVITVFARLCKGNIILVDPMFIYLHICTFSIDTFCHMD